jgi:hypothetical protein
MASHELSNTNRAVIQGFRDLVGDRQYLSDDNQWSRRLVYYHLLKYRNLLLEERMRRRDLSISLFNRQTIPCIELTEVDVHDCPCVPSSGCTFLRTVYPVPQPLGTSFVVNAIDGSINYSFVEWERFKYKTQSRMRGTRESAYFTVKESGGKYYVYVYNDEHRDYVTVTSVFQDPLEVQNFPDCEGKTDPCFSPLDQLFILEEDLIPKMYQVALAPLVETKMSIPPDALNNDQPDQQTTTLK